MSKEKRTVSTRYGEVEVEVVSCSSCEDMITPNSASKFTIGSNSGWACQYCADNPASFPDGEEENNNNSKSRLRDIISSSIALASLIFLSLPLLLLIVYPFGFVPFTLGQTLSFMITGFLLMFIFCVYEAESQ